MATEADSLLYYTAAQVRELERIAIEEKGIPGFVLMRRAGMACFDVLRERWPRIERVAICCGTGNNGGDGFVIAALCREAGMDVTVFLLGDPASIRSDALKAFTLAREREVLICKASELSKYLDLRRHDAVLIDALLGTGLKGAVRDDAAALIRRMNDSRLPVLAVDMPSGLCSDTGEVLGTAVEADATVTFIGRKLGQVRGKGPEYCGQCYFNDLQV